MNTQGLPIIIANCLEPFREEADSGIVPVVQRFVSWAQPQGVHVEMAYHIANPNEIQLPARSGNLRGGIFDDDKTERLADLFGEAGIEVTGDHWAAAAPKTIPNHFSLTHPNEEVRKQTARYLAARNWTTYTLRGCEEGGVQVVGSPAQRNLSILRADGHTISEDQALTNFADTLAKAARYSNGSGVVIALERLAHLNREGDTDIVYSVDQAKTVIDRAREIEPNCEDRLRLMVDTKASVLSGESPTETYGLMGEYVVHHHHIQDPTTLGPAGVGSDGKILGPNGRPIAEDIEYLVTVARRGTRVEISTEIFPAYQQRFGLANRQVYDRLRESNDFLKVTVERQIQDTAP